MNPWLVRKNRTLIGLRIGRHMRLLLEAIAKFPLGATTVTALRSAANDKRAFRSTVDTLKKLQQADLVTVHGSTVILTAAGQEWNRGGKPESVRRPRLIT